ncbi:hypothetical protein [Lentibacillus amyloliquefaciens]|uniref:Uncharacterized protein n=1 Tax=Lentibacillus amyloliquefaciens TaxID=1472767 RepID=A0A0U4E9W7_9BACI|nr:hypothetical protein [Lentibacillus amyloliquefaciens]ALX49697.1 hypothetical protein AOX59_14630 [Lentibacillus amyloliquefaciens]
MMGWLLAILTLTAFILSIYLLDRKPNLSLAIAVITPFALLAVIREMGGEVIFTFFAALFIVIMNVLSRSEIEE